MKTEKIIIGFFALLIVAFAVLTGILMAIPMIPFLLGVFALIACAVALWAIAFYWVNR